MFEDCASSLQRAINSWLELRNTSSENISPSTQQEISTKFSHFDQKFLPTITSWKEKNDTSQSFLILSEKILEVEQKVNNVINREKLMSSSEKHTLTEDQIKEILELQNQFKDFLKKITSELKGKVKPEELKAIKAEYQTLIDLFEDLKEGKIKIALFGKADSGKSSVANSILGADVYTVDVGKGTKVKANNIVDYGVWKIIDTPGFMYSKSDDSQAIQEIKKCHGRIFVIDSEPLKPELEIFDQVKSLFEAPTIVFFNKSDLTLERMPTTDRKKVKELVIEKMSKYVKNPKTDIVFGSARLFDSENDVYVRQPLDDIMKIMYDAGGSLGLVVNIINPAGKASDRINTKVYELREEIARRCIDSHARNCALWSAMPLSSVTSTPWIIHQMNTEICSVMGVSKAETLKAEGISDAYWEAVGASAWVEIAWSIGAFVLAPFTFGGSIALAAGGSIALVAGSTAIEYANNVFRVQVVGEALLEYIRSDFKVIPDVKIVREKLEEKINKRSSSNK